MDFQAPPTIPPQRQGELRDVLLEICRVDADGNIDSERSWQNAVHTVEVLTEIGGGRSGATVLDVNVRMIGQPGFERRVVKVAGVAEIAAEWKALNAVRVRRQNTLIVPIDAVSSDVQEPSQHWLAGQLAAIVYQHVGAFAAMPHRQVQTLEELVASAVGGTTPVEAAIGVVHELTERLHYGLWAPCQQTPGTLREHNRWLGVDLVLEVDRVSENGVLTYQAPTSAQWSTYARTSDDVLEASTRLGLAGSTAIAEGAMVMLRGIIAADNALPDRLRGHVGDVSVEIKRDPAMQGLDLSEVARRFSLRRIAVAGRVAEVRTEVWWRRIVRILPDIVLDAETVELDGVRLRQPFAQLYELLTEHVEGRLIGQTHGDLNPRNVLIIGYQVFLIDFASARERPPLMDPAWLEMCLLRDVFADDLLWPGLIRLQRLLAVATRVVDAAPDWVPDDLVTRESVGVQRAFGVLWSLRKGARDCHRSASGRPAWWREYLAQLSIASLRTLRWDDDQQSPSRIQAAIAAAGVAAEWLGGTPYRHWADSELLQAAQLVVPGLDSGETEAIEVLADLVAAIDRREIVDGPLEEAIDRCRDAIVRRRYAESARTIMVRLQRDHDVYISLRGYAAPQERPAAGQSGLDIYGGRYLTSTGYSQRATEHDRSADPSVDIDLVRAGRPWRRVRRTRQSTDAIDLVSDEWEVVILGEAGSGKSTVARELQYRLAAAITRPPAIDTGPDSTGDRQLPPLLPVTLTASDLNRAIQNSPSDIGTPTPDDLLHVFRDALNRQVPATALAIGAVHVTVDGLNELEIAARKRVAAWIHALRSVYGRTPIVVCHRINGFVPEELPFPTVLLQRVSVDQARTYIRDRFRSIDMDHYEDHAVDLTRRLLDSDDNARIRDLAQTPLFLWMITERFAGQHRLPERVGDLFREFTEWYLNQPHHRREDEAEPSESPFPSAELIAALERLARHLFDRDNITDLAETGAARLLGRHHADAKSVLEVLINSDMLQRDGSNLRFRLQSFQEYFAAKTLQAEDGDTAAFTERVLIFKKREALQILFLFADGSPDLARTLTDLAQRVDPVFAGQLLRWTDNPPADAVDRFLAACESTLFTKSGEYAWRGAVAALFEYGAEGARRLLVTVTQSPDFPLAARSMALGALLRMRSAIRFERMRPAVTADLSAVITRLLAGDTDLSLRVEAADAVGDGHFETHVAYLVALLDGAQAWPVRRAAWRSLAALNQVLASGQRAAFVAACADRLPVCEAELRGAIETSIVDELQDERWEHVQLLSSVGRLDLVLPTRFAFGVADDLYWSVRPLAGDNVDDVPESARPAWRVLREDHTPEELLDLFGSGPELVALAAAHRLLAQRSEHVAGLVDRVSAQSSPSRLLAVAATLATLDEDRLARIRSLVEELIEHMQEDLLEPIAALVSGLPEDDLAGKQLFFRAMTKYRDSFPELMHGPLETAWFRSPPWDSSDYGTTLLAGGDHTYLALLRLAWSTFPLDARRLRTLELGEDALAVIDAYQPETATDRVVHIRACVAAGLLTGLEHAFNAARDPAIAEVRHTYRHRRHGQSRVSALGEVLTCIGYLGRTAADIGHTAGRQAHEFLAAFDTTRHHHTVERGRLLGLAILGDWVSILSALTPGDQHLHRAARNAVEIWAPGPETPNWGVEPEVIARWIGTRLAADQRLLAPDVRSTLSEIKAQIERSLGRIVPPE